jgi:hypothetical protein
MILANPLAGAQPLRIALPRVARKTRVSVSIGIAENYSDRLLIKLARDRTYEKLTHGDVATMKFNWLQDCWWKDIDLTPGSNDELILAQDNAQQKRVGVAYVKLSPALPGEGMAVTASTPKMSKASWAHLSSTWPTSEYLASRMMGMCAYSALIYSHVSLSAVIPASPSAE